MKLDEIAERLKLRNLTPEIPGEANAEALYGHATDLFSDVLANAPHGSVLVTLHVQMNVLAVAIPAGVMAIILLGLLSTISGSLLATDMANRASEVLARFVRFGPFLKLTNPLYDV